uniref:C2H2-type domain-containing protein n=1 Tax=Anopheles funestus TaxID=62324 RepID=A0A182RB66_ANOFN
MVALQPWNGKDGNKMLLHTSKLTDQFLTAPFKCTAFNCGFYTNTSQTMASHFQRHQKLTTVHPITRDSSWLECCYCNYVSLSVHNLLQHIETVHKYSAYQCDRCCYRSRDPNSVRVHQLNYHLEYDADAKIVWIPSRQKEYSSMDRDIIMNHLKINFNDMEEYQNHMKAHGLIYIACHVCDLIVAANKMIDHISSHNIFMIQCIYCDYGINDVNTIMKHVVDEHSDELLCYHVRCSKNVPPFIRVQNRISPERFINCEQNF